MRPTGRFYPALGRERRNRRAWHGFMLAGAFLALFVAFVAMIMLAMSGLALVGR